MILHPLTVGRPGPFFLGRILPTAPFSSPGMRLIVTTSIAAILVVMVTVVIYMPGLHGPYLLDDIGNLEPLKRWVEGRLGWQGVVFDNRSGPTGRPLSMLTFLLDAARNPSLQSFAFKPTNLAIHILCGALVFALARTAATSAGLSPNKIAVTAGFIAVCWLWLPVQVSTVLYIVQRMAQLATLFSLACVLTYIVSRRRIDNGCFTGHLLLWIAVPIFGAMATLSKENGALALPLCAVAEFTLFRLGSRSKSVLWFLSLTVALPVAAALIYLASHPRFFVNGYGGRDFTLGERLLTEPRVLWSYLQTAFFPVGPRMGIFHDNFPLSTDVVNPLTTLPAIIAWIAVAIWAFVWRQRAPLFAYGVFSFFTAHLMESGPISLELYFEHRNYLPSIFALIALAGLIHSFSLRLTSIATRALAVCGIALLGIYAIGTWNHATGWSRDDTFYAMQYDFNPTSPRLLSNLAARAILDHDLPEALHFIDESDRYSPASERATSSLWRMLAYCESEKTPPEQIYQSFDHLASGRITTFAMVAWELLAQRIEDGCSTLDVGRIVSIANRWTNTTNMRPDAQEVWRTRYNSARMLARVNRLREARDLAHLAWIESARNNGIGVFLFQLNASLGDIAQCREVLQSLERASNGSNKDLTDAINAFRLALDRGDIRGPSP